VRELFTRFSQTSRWLTLDCFPSTVHVFFPHYSRLHEDEIQEPATNVFSAWKWLHSGASSTTTKDEPSILPVQPATRQEQDALYALGVAGLASKKLLQKHRVSSDQLRDASVKEDAVAAKVESSRHKMFDRATRVVQTIAATRQSLHKFQSHKMRGAAKSVVRAPFVLGRKVFALGGGRHTVGVTATVAVALVFVLAKPVAHFVANESVNMTRGA